MQLEIHRISCSAFRQGSHGARVALFLFLDSSCVPSHAMAPASSKMSGSIPNSQRTTIRSQIDTSFEATAKPGTVSAEDQVANKFSDWLTVAFEYYRDLGGGKQITSAKQMRSKLADYLDKMSHHLRNESTSALGTRLSASSNSTSSDSQCRICLESEGESRYAVLENCDHKYCEPCMRSWVMVNPNQPVQCPTCRALSSRILLSAHFLLGELKKAEFDTMICCPAHQLVPENQEEETDANEDIVIILDDANDDFIDAAAVDDPNDPDFVPEQEELGSLSLDEDEIVLVDPIYNRTRQSESSEEEEDP